jgi:SAM-dependent MidA family methyltransferase
LYDPGDGFYTRSGQAGRRGDFLTSPEVGPLFGAVVANALDLWWRELGQPDPFTVVECGAGPGTLARSVVAAQPACSSALRYVLVERSASQRSQHPTGDPFVSAESLPDEKITGIVLANELLDNLPFDLVVYDGGWQEAWVDRGSDGRLVEVLRPLAARPDRLPTRAPLGSRAPQQSLANQWVSLARSLVAQGCVIAIDYTSTTPSMAARPWREWLRTYRGHERGGHYLANPGEQDITCEVAVDQLPEPDAVRTQVQWLQLHGIDELVEAGRRQWEADKASPSLASLKARSRVREAEALLDSASLGAFTVLEWHCWPDG